MSVFFYVIFASHVFFDGVSAKIFCQFKWDCFHYWILSVPYLFWCKPFLRDSSLLITPERASTDCMVGWKCLDQRFWSHPDFVIIVLLLMAFQLSGQRSDFMSIFNKTFKEHDAFLNCCCPRSQSNRETRLPGSTPPSAQRWKLRRCPVLRFHRV